MRTLIAGNWKMHGSMAMLAELDAMAAAAAADDAPEVAVFPPFTLIAAAAERQPDLAIGGQDCHWLEHGAHTGCIAPGMLVEAGARMVIAGHSERRADNGETDREVRQKAEAAIAAGLHAIVCVGEGEGERTAGRAIDVVEAMLAGSLPSGGAAEQLSVAYEPVWAVGTGRTPIPDEIAEMHGAIGAVLTAILGSEGRRVRILYGGSVKAGNAGAILAVPGVAGLLVGGASLTAADFVPVIKAATATRRG